MKPKNYLATGFAGLLSLNYGCGYKPKMMPQLNIQQCSIQLDRKEYDIGVEPFDTNIENKPVWDHNVNSKGYLPILIAATNNLSNKEVILYGSGQISFADNMGVKWEECSGQRMAKSFEKNPTAEGMTMGFLLGVLSGFMA